MTRAVHMDEPHLFQTKAACIYQESCTSWGQQAAEVCSLLQLAVTAQAQLLHAHGKLITQAWHIMLNINLKNRQDLHTLHFANSCTRTTSGNKEQTPS